jgi:deoxyuridine 5'-triphosphate nucleotidohydrolase
VDIPFKVVDPRAVLPVSAYAGTSAGFDLTAIETIPVKPARISDVRTGLAIDLPTGYYARIVHRSSTARKRGFMVIEGTIDAGFQGELLIGCYQIPGYHPDASWPTVTAGESIAQLIVQEFVPINWCQVPKFAESIRGERGFGSSDGYPARDQSLPL